MDAKHTWRYCQEQGAYRRCCRPHIPFTRLEDATDAGAETVGQRRMEYGDLRCGCDWPLRVYRAVGDAEAAMASKRLAVLLKSFSPSAIVVKREGWDRAQTNSHIKSLAQAMIRVASAHSVPIFLVEQDNVRKTFGNMGCETRDEIAVALARIFPELVWRLPPKRRAWQAAVW